MFISPLDFLRRAARVAGVTCVVVLVAASDGAQEMAPMMSSG
jgi:hypothetical protein